MNWKNLLIRREIMTPFTYGNQNGFNLEKVFSWKFSKSEEHETIQVNLIEGEVIFLHDSDVTRFFDEIRSFLEKTI